MHFIGRTGLGWTQIELTLVRLNTSEVPNATFPLTAPLTVLPGEFEAVGARMGIDAAICVEAIEPWVVEVFNSSVGVGAGGGNSMSSPERTSQPEGMGSAGGVGGQYTLKAKALYACEYFPPSHASLLLFLIRYNAN